MMTSSGKKRNRVHFAEEVHTVAAEIPKRSELSEEECKLLWFNNDDFIKIRAQAFEVCRQSKATTFATLLQKSYATPQKMLDLWAFHGGVQRGLEAWVSDGHSKTRKVCRLYNTKGIIEQQRRLRSEQADLGTIEQNLYNASLAHSASARSFARRMALADRRAALVEQLPGKTNNASTVTFRQSSVPSLALHREPELIHI